MSLSKKTAWSELVLRPVGSRRALAVLGDAHRGHDDLFAALGTFIDFTSGAQKAVAATSPEVFFRMCLEAIIANDCFHIPVIPEMIFAG